MSKQKTLQIVAAVEAGRDSKERGAKIMDALIKNVFEPLALLEKRDIHNEIVSRSIRSHLVFVMYEKCYVHEKDFITMAQNSATCSSNLSTKHSAVFARVRENIVNAHSFAILAKLGHEVTRRAGMTALEQEEVINFLPSYVRGSFGVTIEEAEGGDDAAAPPSAAASSASASAGCVDNATPQAKHPCGSMVDLFAVHSGLMQDQNWVFEVVQFVREHSEDWIRPIMYHQAFGSLQQSVLQKARAAAGSTKALDFDTTIQIVADVMQNFMPENWCDYLIMMHEVILFKCQPYEKWSLCVLEGEVLVYKLLVKFLL